MVYTGGFWVPPIIIKLHRWWVEWFLDEKSLSVKVPINKEDSGIVDGFLMKWEFDFCG